MFGNVYRYHTRVCSIMGGSVRSSSGLAVETVSLDTVREYETFIVVGGQGPRKAAACDQTIMAVRQASEQSRRTASICTGAFVLAATGLLDGRRATTHWRHTAELQQKYPNVRVDGNRIFVRDGPIWSSAGITAGIDLALALIEEDLGATVSKSIAGELIVYHRRSGGQSQFSAPQALQPDSDRIRKALEYARAHLREKLSVAQLAEAACLSPRHFTRRFRAETGESPARAIERLRVEAAQRLIEDDQKLIEQIARAVGFSDPERMRRAFLRIFGQPPQALRRASRGQSTLNHHASRPEPGGKRS